jgi:hypothetical protein
VMLSPCLLSPCLLRPCLWLLPQRQSTPKSIAGHSQEQVIPQTLVPDIPCGTALPAQLVEGTAALKDVDVSGFDAIFLPGTCCVWISEMVQTRQQHLCLSML